MDRKALIIFLGFAFGVNTVIAASFIIYDSNTDITKFECSSPIVNCISPEFFFTAYCTKEDFTKANITAQAASITDEPTWTFQELHVCCNGATLDNSFNDLLEFSSIKKLKINGCAAAADSTFLPIYNINEVSITAGSDIFLIDLQDSDYSKSIDEQFSLQKYEDGKVLMLSKQILDGVETGVQSFSQIVSLSNVDPNNALLNNLITRGAPGFSSLSEIMITYIYR